MSRIALVAQGLLIFVPLLVQLFWVPRYMNRVRDAVAAGNETARTKMYQLAIVRSSVLAVLCVCTLAASGYSLEEQGFVRVQEWGLAGYVLAAMVLALGAPLLLAYLHPPSELTAVGNIHIVIPRSQDERRWFALTGVCAGITEEITHRALPILFWSYVLPGTSLWVPLAISAVTFGAAHAYQGWSGIAVTCLLGLIFGFLYLETASLLPGMVAHVLLDLRLLVITAIYRRSSATDRP